MLVLAAVTQDSNPAMIKQKQTQKKQDQIKRLFAVMSTRTPFTKNNHYSELWALSQPLLLNKFHSKS